MRPQSKVLGAVVWLRSRYTTRGETRGSVNAPDCTPARSMVTAGDVPSGRTVVGIPGKVVHVREAGTVNPYGIDLDHHLIPDPVGRAISCLMERLETLEARVARASHGGPTANPEECEDCESHTICDRGVPELQTHSDPSMRKIAGGERGSARF